jgi:peptide deformylase
MRSLVLYGDPVLRRTAKPVTAFDDELRDLVEEMFEIMYAEEGVGLAAPQVGDSRRVFIIEIPEDDESEGVQVVMVNPVVQVKSGSVVAEEGCLSIPGIREKVERAEALRVTFQDLDGEARELEAEGFLARAIQHEQDHLDGVLFVDRLSPMRRKFLKRQLDEIAAGRIPPESARED